MTEVNQFHPIPLNSNVLINVSYLFDSRLLSEKKFQLKFTFLIPTWSSSVREPDFFRFLYSIVENSILPLISTEFRLNTIQIETLGPPNKIKVFRCPLRFAFGKAPGQVGSSLFCVDLYAQNTLKIKKQYIKGVVENFKNFDRDQNNPNNFVQILQLEQFFTKTHEMLYLDDPTPVCTLRFVKLVEQQKEVVQKEVTQKRKVDNKQTKQVYKKPAYRFIQTAVVRGFLR
jgi:hypothetical protein